MPFFRNFFHLLNLVVRLRVGMATEPTLDLGTLRRIQRSTNLQDLAGEIPSQAFIVYPASPMSGLSIVSSIASDSDGESLTTDSDGHADSDSEDDDDTVLYMATRTKSPAQGKYRLAIKGCSGIKRNKKFVDLLQLKGQNMSCRAEATTIGNHYNSDDDSSDDDDERGILVFSSTRQKLLVSA
ncbi:hypothetical protein EHS25_009921 [Saitozyma podzolica]|uniref:Uncharacterized protein n=1 Tax=Saitozyma podzolica TaxID=1890683 RepID=A0A427YI29_9TREE|nr:hypothetical protein EHS25_009921 [Saitozyma podzolica]